MSAPEAAVANRENATSPLFAGHYPSSKVVTPNTRSSRNGGFAPVYMRAVSNTGTSPRSCANATASRLMLGTSRKIFPPRRRWPAKSMGPPRRWRGRRPPAARSCSPCGMDGSRPSRQARHRAQGRNRHARASRSRRVSRREVHDEQHLPAFNLLWIWPLLFPADENGARAWSPKSTGRHTSVSECATSSTARMAPIRTSISSRSGVEMRGLMGAEFMYHSLLRLGRSRRTRSHSSANRVHRDWSWRDEAWSRRGWESRDCRAPTASSGRPG